MNADARPDTTGLRDAEAWRDREGFEIRRRCDGCVNAAFNAGTTARPVRMDWHDKDCPLLAAHPDPTPEPDAEDSNGERSSSGEPDAGDAHDHAGPDWRCEACKPLATVLRARMRWASMHWGGLHDDAYPSLARAVMDSDWLAHLLQSAREQGRAEGEAGWAAAVEGLADIFDSRYGPFPNGFQHSLTIHEVTGHLRALLTTDRTKALDAVKAQAGRTVLLEAANQLDRDGMKKLSARTVKQWLRARADQIGGAS